MLALKVVECGLGIDPLAEDSEVYVRLRMTRVSALDTTYRVNIEGGYGFRKQVNCCMVLWKERIVCRKEWSV